MTNILPVPPVHPATTAHAKPADIHPHPQPPQPKPSEPAPALRPTLQDIIDVDETLLALRG